MPVSVQVPEPVLVNVPVPVSITLAIVPPLAPPRVKLKPEPVIELSTLVNLIVDEFTKTGARVLPNTPPCAPLIVIKSINF